MRNLLTLLTVLALAAAASAATITIVNVDDPGEGFNDPTPLAPVGGNPGTTVGAQRLNLFQHAADIWGGLLPSGVPILIRASFDPLTCTETGAVLGSAGPLVVNRDFSGAPQADTWYHGALSDKLAGTDLDPGTEDIRARFNAALDGSPECLGGRGWYYGFDGNAGTDIALLPVLLHEMGHGLGFSTFVDESDGSEFFGSTDIYARHLLDNVTGLHWDEMNDAQRAASAVNTGHVVWDGAAVTAAAPGVLNGRPILETVAPGTLPPTMALGVASFGPSLDVTGVTEAVVLADDGAGADPEDACETLLNAAQIAGRIALVDRGNCTFATKAFAAEAAGAVAVIIVDNAVSDTPPGLGGTAPGLTIPAVSVTLADGNLLKAALPGAVVTLRRDPSLLAGADDQGRVLIYAPDPIEPGSSISHFDTSADPSLLMEPAITPLLNDEVDLTLQHFVDIGWFTGEPTAVDGPLPTPVDLAPAYPNPFNPRTTLAFRTTGEAPVRLAVYDAAGRLVRTLVDGVLPAGEHAVNWNGEHQDGRRGAAGVYFVRLQEGAASRTRTVVMLK
ncbi:MAG TPA: FlgD immunoglobulin-like domain containing protein [Candidatus Krumholzibacteria bacterium]|nr:FlgD immunoglobulin-like domain containing protein [Candidatus Krumholzibacteria bacterium]HRX50616.1 FlgD immunoglobulin-like domain containing protein [Candidatus Krumholzibacteria bacterium]